VLRLHVSGDFDSVAYIENWIARLNERLAAMHTYEVPEAIAIPVVDGSAAYLDWLERELTPQGNS
jgi:uncharacterized protein involved in tolerance to divalent cations